jgi:CBS domain-containing protein
VRDAMTSGQVYSIGPDDTVEHALEKLVQHRVTGLPVVDAAGTVIGVVADSDLLALHTLGRVNIGQEKQMFPEVDVTWQAFTAVKRLLAKSGGKKIRDVMSSNPITVTADTDLDEAARIILVKRIRRLPVVDADGRLVGVLSRGNLVKAALALRTAA